MRIYQHMLLILVTTLMFLSGSLYAGVSSYEKYCIDKGGSVELAYAQFETHSGFNYGYSQKHCTFKIDRGTLSIGLRALGSEQPNIAATLIKTLPKIDHSSPLWDKELHGNPSYPVCQRLGGFNVTIHNESGGYSGMCVFGDGSMVDTWSLIYIVNGRTGFDVIKKYIRSQPLDSKVPSSEINKK